jgi:hypothetical protein
MFLWLLDSLTTFATTSLPTAMEQEKQDEDTYRFYIMVIWEHEEKLSELGNPDPQEFWECQRVMQAYEACASVYGKWYLDWLYVPRRRKAVKLAQAFIARYMSTPQEFAE